MGRIPRRLAPVLFASILLVGSLTPLWNPGRGSAESEQVLEMIEEPVQAGEYLFGPVSGQRYLIVKNMEEERTYYFGEGLVFHDYDSLVAYEMGLIQDSCYKLDPKLQDAMADGSKQNEIVGIVVEMKEQPS
ncbi:MAG: hypothetical protein KAW09_09800, partial [Thermoplasmata archaeon]|nr:hypothetical protein [Thermoplasmata archaeon]